MPKPRTLNDVFSRKHRELYAAPVITLFSGSMIEGRGECWGCHFTPHTRECYQAPRCATPVNDREIRNIWVARDTDTGESTI